MPVAIPIVGYAAIAGFELTGLAAAAVTIASSVAYGIVSSEQARRQQRQALEASRRDNVTMVRSAEQPHRWVYGEARISGPIVFTHTAGTENAQLYLVVVMTGHECAESLEVLFNETNLGITEGDVLVGSSYFQGSLKLFTHELEGADGTPIQTTNTVGEFTGVLDGSLRIIVPVTGTLASVIAVQNAINQSSGGFDFFGSVPLEYSINFTTNTVTVTEPGAFAGMEVIIFWTEWVGAALVNIKSYLGAPNQLADQMLMDETGGRWSANHRLRGRAYVRARLLWNYQKFLSGIPNLSARFRGWKLPDLRSPTDADVWSDNPALAIRHYIQNAWGVTDDEIDDDSFITAANICDELIVVDPDDTSDPVLWRQVLSQAVADGTWEADLANETIDLDERIADLTVDAGGSLSVDSSHATYAENALLVGNASAGYSTYVNLPFLGAQTDGNVTVRCGFPAGNVAIGFTFRSTSITSPGDSFNGYRVDLVILAGTPTLRLFKSTGASLSLLGSATVSDVPPTGDNLTPITIGASFTGSSLEVFYNGVSKFSATEGTYSTGVFRLLAYKNPPGVQMYFFDLIIDAVAAVFHQKRYTVNGSFTVDRTREDILQSLLSSCAGMMAVTGGQWRLTAGAYVTPTLTLTNEDLRGPITIVPKKALRDVFNVVRGIFAGKGTFDQPTDFPPVTSTIFQDEDGGEISTNIELEFTNESIMAQRIALIHLRRHRSAISVQMPCKLGQALALRPGDSVMLTFSDLNWTEKVFRVEGWSLRCDEDWGIDLVLQEDDPDNYDWSPTDASINGLPAIVGISSDDMISEDIASDEFVSDEALSDELDTDAS